MRNKEDNAVQDVTRTNEEAVFEELEIHDNVKASLAHDFILVCIPCGSEPAKARSSWCRKVCAIRVDLSEHFDLNSEERIEIGAMLDRMRAIAFTRRRSR